MKLVYHPLSCVINNKRFTIILNGMTTVCIWDWQSFGLLPITLPTLIMLTASTTIQVQNSAREQKPIAGECHPENT